MSANSVVQTQIQDFFSRLAASRCKAQGLLGMSVETEEDVECLVNDTERQELLDEIEDEVGHYFSCVRPLRILSPEETISF